MLAGIFLFEHLPEKYLLRWWCSYNVSDRSRRETLWSCTKLR